MTPAHVGDDGRAPGLFPVRTARRAILPVLWGDPGLCLGQGPLGAGPRGPFSVQLGSQRRGLPARGGARRPRAGHDLDGHLAVAHEAGSGLGLLGPLPGGCDGDGCEPSGEGAIQAQGAAHTRLLCGGVLGRGRGRCLGRGHPLSRCRGRVGGRVSRLEEGGNVAIPVIEACRSCATVIGDVFSSGSPIVVGAGMKRNTSASPPEPITGRAGTKLYSTPFGSSGTRYRFSSSQGRVLHRRMSDPPSILGVVPESAAPFRPRDHGSNRLLSPATA